MNAVWMQAATASFSPKTFSGKLCMVAISPIVSTRRSAAAESRIHRAGGTDRSPSQTRWRGITVYRLKNAVACWFTAAPERHAQAGMAAPHATSDR